MLITQANRYDSSVLNRQCRTWRTPTLESTEVLAGNPYTKVVNADPADGYGAWSTGRIA